jgi:tetratricopeptide (TPR) repeat protein
VTHTSESFQQRLAHARVCIELREYPRAELELAELLERDPDSQEALTLLAKLKHIRGELSLAIACWAQLHARDAQDTMAQLRAILHLATDPERGAGEFVLIGRLQMARKPAVNLELEEAFLELLQRRPDEARGRCERLARKHHDHDREVFKLATLASAWIAELSGEPEQAAHTLENLGHEPGFEDDPDRVLLLARLYERLGTPGKLEAAAHIYEVMWRRHGRLSLLGRLTAIHRRLGQSQRAQAFEARFLAGFRAHMHRPCFAEVIGVAARSYLPLGRLRELRLPDTQIPVDATRRERAIARSLTGVLAVARDLFERGGELLDRKYLADLDVFEGDFERATTIYMDVLQSDPEDLDIAGWLLDRYDETGSPELAAFFARPEVADPVRATLEHWIRSAPLDPLPWRRLAVLGGMPAGGSSPPTIYGLVAPPIGRVRAAASYHFIGKSKGLVHEIRVGRELTQSGQGGTLALGHIRGHLGPDATRAVQDIFFAVREYARVRFPHLCADLFDYVYSYEIAKEDEPAYGLSAGLPSAIAFLSVFLQQPVSGDLALAGALVADGLDELSLRPVGDAEHKVKGAYNCNLRAIVLPLLNRSELRAGAQVPLPVQDELVRYAADFDEAVRIVFGADVFRASPREDRIDPTGVAPARTREARTGDLRA